MGVKGLWQLLLPTGRRISIETLSGKRLAVDASIWLTQFLKANRDPEMGKVRANAHIIGFLRRICRLLYHGIRPVFVFDGETPAIKLREIKARRERRERLQSFKSDDDNEGVKRLARRLLIANLKKQKELEKAEEKLQNGKKVKDAMKVIKNATMKGAKNTGAFVDGFVLPEDENENENDQKDSEKQQHRNSTEKSKVDVDMDSVKREEEVIELSDSEDYLKIAKDYHQPIKQSDWDNVAGDQSDGYGGSDDDDSDGSIEIQYDDETFDVETLAHLDSKTRVDIIEKARRQQRMDTRRSLVSVSANPQSYSQCQIKNFLKSATLNNKVNQLGKVVAMKGEDGLEGERIASDGTRRFILTKDGDEDTNDGKSNGNSNDGFGSKLKRRMNNNDSKAPERKRLRKSTRDAESDSDSDSDVIFDKEKEVQLFGYASFDDESEDDVGGGGFIAAPDIIENKRQCITIASSDESDDSTGGGGFMPSSSKVSGCKSDKSEILNISSGGESNSSIVSHAKVHSPGILSRPEANTDRREVGNLLDNIEEANDAVDIARDCDEGGFIAAASTSDAGDSEGGGGFIIEEKPQGVAGPVKAIAAASEDYIDIDWEDGKEHSGDDEVIMLSHGKDDLSIHKDVKPNQHVDGDAGAVADNNQGGGESRNQGVTIAPCYESDDSMGGGFILEGSDSDNLDKKEVLCATRGDDLNANDDDDIDWEDGEEDVEIVEVAADIFHDTGASKNKVIAQQDKDVKINERVTSSPRQDKPSNGCVDDDKDEEIDWQDGKEDEKIEDLTTLSERKEESTDTSSPQGGDEGEDADCSNETDVNIVQSDVKWEDGKGVDNQVDGGKEKKENNPVESKSNNDEDIISRSQLEQIPSQMIHEEFTDTSLEALSMKEKLLRDDDNRRERDMDTITDDMIEEVMQLLQFFGIPYIKAPAEAESQCAELERLGLVDGVVTEDSDAIVFGCKAVYRNCFDDKRFLEVYLSSDAEKIGLGHNEKIALAMLLGGDYTDGVKGVGIVNGMEILQTFTVMHSVHDGLKAFRKWLDGFDLGNHDDEKEHTAISNFHKKHKTARTRWIAAKDFPSPSVLQAYTKPVVDSSDEQFIWELPNIDNIRLLCSRRIGWDASETDQTVMPVIERMKNGTRQTRIDGYFMRTEDNIKFAEIKSKRLREVWNLDGNKEKEKIKDKNGAESMEEGKDTIQ